MMHAIMKKTRCVTTIAAPVGRENEYDAMKPIRNASADSAAATMDTERYVFATLIAVIAGNIMRDEMRSEPSILIPTTIMTAVRTARSDV